MKYLLLIHMNPTVWESLTQEERDAVMSGHDGFQKSLRESGELLGFVALADPANSTVVQVRDGRLSVTDGPYVEAKEFLAGYYAVECETPERGAELAGMIPDAAFNAIEVRPVMADEGLEM